MEPHAKDDQPVLLPRDLIKGKVEARLASVRCIKGRGGGGGKEKGGERRGQSHLIWGLEGSWETKKGRLGWSAWKMRTKFQINVDDNNIHRYVPIKIILLWTEKDVMRQCKIRTATIRVTWIIYE